MKYSKIVKAVCGEVWAIQAAKLDAIAEFLTIKIEGGSVSEAEIKALSEQSQSRRAASQGTGNIALLQLYGIVAQRLSGMEGISGPGGTSTESFTKQLNAALKDSSISAIIIDVDSPGGTVYGVEELAKKIYESRTVKPIVAIANSLAASAAYWIASAAGELVMMPGGDVGSIGVFAVHEDKSVKEENDGTKTTILKAGKYKAEGNPHEPLSEDAIDYMQARLNDIYGVFVKTVARNRGVSVEKVRSDYGQGRVVGSAEALRAGMVDRIETLEQLIARLQSKNQRTRITNQNNRNAIEFRRRSHV